jgi:WD40 repeat protein
MLFFSTDMITGFLVCRNADGKTPASGGDDDLTIWWDVTTGSKIGAPLIGQTDNVSRVAFSPDNKTLASGGPDGLVILWNLDPEYWKAQACNLAGRNFTRAEWKQYFPSTEYRATCSQ